MLNRINKKELENILYDLIVIGGGINGCGIARDAAMRGLSVLLLEKDDFGSGCTYASTRLIHGGLRYLEHFEFDLVRESLREREMLLKNASHLVRPIKLSVPIYKTNKRGYVLIKLGMLLYDFLSFDKSLPSHKMLSASEFRQIEPSVNTSDLKGAAIYHDAQVIHPERICLESVLMAKTAGAHVLNHAQVSAFHLSNNQIKFVEFQDMLTSLNYKVRSKLVVNASGPWVDKLCNLSGSNIERKMGGTKGSHIFVAKFADGPQNALYVSASDGRPFFIIPWENYYLIGTTDIPFEQDDLDNVHATKAEVDYLIVEANKMLKHKISLSDVLFTYSGVRPLPYSPGVSPEKKTRKHIICDHEVDGLTNFLSVIGGKLTTYRGLSEELVNYVTRKLSSRFKSSATKSAPFLGNIPGDLNSYKKAEVKKIQTKFGLDKDIVNHLIDIYGQQYINVVNLLKDKASYGYLLSTNSLDIKAQVYYAIKHEFAFTISDIIFRRLSLGLSRDFGIQSVEYIASALKEELGYSDAEIKKQVADYDHRVRCFNVKSS